MSDTLKPVRLSQSGIACKGHVEIHVIAFCGGSSNSLLKVYDGTNSNGVHMFDLKCLAANSREIISAQPMHFEHGCYLEFDSNLLSATVCYKNFPKGHLHE